MNFQIRLLKMIRSVSLPQKTRRLSSLPFLEIRNDLMGNKGRGYFACQHIKAGQLILLEKRIEAETLGGLAKKILRTSGLSEWLYSQDIHPVQQAVPDDLEIDVSDVLWSRALLQAAFNGCVALMLIIV